MQVTYSDYYETLLSKSEEAYLMALEIVNKPTINYRTEGFCFFICNAWELLLKAFIVRQSQRIDSIYYSIENNRTYSLSNCIEKVFTSTTDKTKTNLSYLVSIRNRATHTVLPDYDYEFVPLFQQNISYFNKFFTKHFSLYKFNQNVTPFIAINRSPTRSISPLTIIEDSTRFMETIRLAAETEGIGQNVIFSITKKPDDADIKVAISKDAKDKITFVDRPKDVNAMYPYAFKKVVKAIQESLELTLGAHHGFTEKSFHRIAADFKMKENETYCYNFKYAQSIVKTYSQETINFIIYNYSQNKAFKDKYEKKYKKRE